MVADPSTLALFALASVALLVVPGPAVLYIVARSVDQGRRAGLVSTLGIHVGSLVHVAAAAVGLSSLLVSSATAFETVKYLGAAYLVYLGIRRLLERDVAPGEARPPMPLRRVFGQAIVVNVLNPKTALFFFAFLPQFVDVSAGHAGLQIALLGVLYIAIGLVSDGAYALVAGTVVRPLRRRAGFMRTQRCASGATLIGLGFAAAVSGRSNAK